MPSPGFQNLAAVRAQHLLVEFASLKYASPRGVYMSLTPNDPTLWSGVIFIHKGPYASAILRFHISFPIEYPALPPLVTFNNDIFHPLVTPLTTYTYTTSLNNGDTVSATDEERLPPGGFSLRHGFPHWFGRSRKTRGNLMAPGRVIQTSDLLAETHSPSSVSPASHASESPGSSSQAPTTQQVSVVEVLTYIRSSFDDEAVLDSMPLEAAGNPNAWHARQTYLLRFQSKAAAKRPDAAIDEKPFKDGKPLASAPSSQSMSVSVSKQPSEWNWEGVWEERVKRGVEGSLAEPVLYGHVGGGDDLIRFLNMDLDMIETIKENLKRSVEITVVSKSHAHRTFESLDFGSAAIPHLRPAWLGGDKMDVGEFYLGYDRVFRELSSPKTSPISSVWSHSSSNFAPDGSEDEFDPTPKPLRVVKNGRFGSSEVRTRRSTSSSNSGISHSLTASFVDVPRRLSSATFHSASGTSSTHSTMDLSIMSSSEQAEVGDDSKTEISTILDSPTASRGPDGGSDLKVKKKRVQPTSMLLPESNGGPVKPQIQPSSMLLSESAERLVKPRAQTYSLVPPAFSIPNYAAQEENGRLRSRDSSHQTSLKSSIPSKPSGKPDRSVTVGSYLQSELLRPSTSTINPGISFVPTLSTPTGVRRATSTTTKFERPGLRSSKESDMRFSVDSDFKQSHGQKAASRDYIRWEPSGKKTVLSRVFSSFNKSRSMGVLRASSGTPDPLSSQETPNWPKRESSHKLSSERSEDRSSRSRSTRSSSVHTYCSTQSTIEETIAAFPQPPQSGSNSPNGIGPSPTFTKSVHLRLATPSRPVILGLKTTILPEIESIDTEGGQTIWVAVDVMGDVTVPRHCLEIAPVLRPCLDVVVLIDLSAYTSTGCFNAAREITSFIASQLDPVKDRLAVVCSTFAEGKTGSRVVFSLRPVQSVNLKTTMSTLDHTSHRPASSHLRSALECSITMLLNSQPTLPLNQSKGDTLSLERYGHVFVVSAHAGNWKEPSSSQNNIQFHIVHPGILPWKGQEGSSNGWQLRSLYPPRLGSTALNLAEGGLPDQLRSVIRHAKLAAYTGTITNVKVQVAAASNCSVEAILGSAEAAALRPGGSMALLVRLRVGALKILSAPADHCGQDAISLLAQLDAMLGEAAEEILTVKVSYQHSLLSPESTVTITSKGRLKRHAAQSGWRASSSSPSLNDNKDRRHQVQQRLAFFIGSNHSPRKALAALHDVFGHDGCVSVCPAYLKLLTHELKYQLRISERYRLHSSDSGDSSSAMSSGLAEFVGGSLYDMNNQISATTSIHDSRPRIPSTIEEGSPQEPSSPMTTTAVATPATALSLISERSPDRPPSRESVDEARRIWTDMRRARRWGMHASSVTDPADWAASDEGLMELKLSALRNKRSLGADTLRSLRAGEEGKGRGMVAPWL